jgi:hypothetical protein
MGARDVTGLVRLGGGKSSILIKIEGRLSPRCSLQDIRREIEAILSACGLSVRLFRVNRTARKKRKKK